MPLNRAVVPNAVTAANISVGFASILTASEGRYDTAVHLLLCAIFLDMLDGRLARRLKATSELGRQMDSLSDAISFGVAPAFLAQRALLQPLHGVGVAVAVTYLLAGVFRLARFNIISDPHQKARRTVGVPIPIGAGYVMAAVLMRDEIPAEAGAALLLVLAVLMASQIALPDLKGKSVVSAMMVVGIFNYLAVVAWPNWYTVGWWNVWNVLILAMARQEDRRLAAREAES